MRKFLIFLFLIFYAVSISFGQNRIMHADSSKRNYKEFGMNMTGLVNQFIPFKQVSNKTGPFSASYKSVSGRSSFRLGLGMHIITDDNFGGVTNDIINFNLRIGMGRHHYVNERFTFYQTFDFMLVAGNFNSPINDFNDNDNVGVGAGLGLGIEYYLFENLSISTEGIGFVGLVSGTSSIFSATVLPPIAIFLNYKF